MADIEEIIPQLADVDNSVLEYVSFRNWDNRMKTIVTKNLSKYRRSLSSTSIGNYFRPCIICIYDDYMEISKKKYDLIRKYVTSEEFNKK